MAIASARRDPGEPGQVEAVSLDTAYPKKVEIGVRRIPEPTSVIGAFDPRKVSDDQLDMMRVDSEFALGMAFVQSMIANANWRIECDDRRVREWTSRAYGRVHMQLMRDAMMGMWFGRAPLVIDYERISAFSWTYHDEETGKERHAWPHPDVRCVVPKSVRGLFPVGARPIFDEGDGDRFLGFEHPAYSRRAGFAHPDGGQGLFVPAERCLWVVHDRAGSYGSMFGRPRTLSGFRAWWAYWFGFLMADRHLENDADPPLEVLYPPGKSQDPDDPTKTIDNAELAARIGIYLREGGTITTPSETYTTEEGKPTSIRKWEVKFITGGENLPAFEDRLERLRKLKLASILLPPEILDRAGGDVTAASDMFLETQVLAVSELDDQINEHFLPKLVAANFSEAPPVRKATTGIRDRDKRLYEEILKIMVASLGKELGVDYRAMADAVGLPLTAPEEPEPVPEELGGPPAPQSSEQGGSAAGGQGDPPEERARKAGAAPTGRKRTVEGPGSRGPDTGRSGQRA